MISFMMNLTYITDYKIATICMTHLIRVINYSVICIIIGTLGERFDTTWSMNNVDYVTSIQLLTLCWQVQDIEPNKVKIKHYGAIIKHNDVKIKHIEEKVRHNEVKIKQNNGVKINIMGSR